jgi:glycine cleavage system H protein
MEHQRPATLSYKRARFTTQLPVNYLYSPSHCWIAPPENDLCRVGLTKFATRMLGEMVDCGFGVEADAPVAPGKIIGWVEGFKAISDLFCVAEGLFGAANPLLKEKIAVVSKEPYGAGWLYTIKGKPDGKCVDVHGYVKILDKTIDKILEKQPSEE